MSRPGVRVRSLLAQPWARAFLLALAVRGVLALLLGPPLLPDDDQRAYLALRDGIRTHGAFLDPATLAPTAFRDPGYPVLLAAIAAVCGPGLAPILVVQVLLGAITAALLTAAAARRGGPRAGRIAVALTGLALPHAALAGTIYSENLAAPLLAWLVFRLAREPAGDRDAGLTGMLAGALALVRAAIAPIALVLLAAGGRGARRWIVLAIVAFLVLPGAWSLRNQARVGVLTPNTNGIYNVYLGTHARTPTDHPYRAMNDPAVHAGLPAADERTRTAAAADSVRASWRARPGHNLRLAAAKVVDALGPDRMLAGLVARGQFPSADPRVARWLGFAVALGGLLVAIAGLASALSWRDPWARAGALALATSLLVQAVSLGHPRFTLLVWLLLIPGAATTLARAHAGSARERRALAVAALLLVGIAALQLRELSAVLSTGS